MARRQIRSTVISEVKIKPKQSLQASTKERKPSSSSYKPRRRPLTATIRKRSIQRIDISPRRLLSEDLYISQTIRENQTKSGIPIQKGIQTKSLQVPTLQKGIQKSRKEIQLQKEARLQEIYGAHLQEYLDYTNDQCIDEDLEEKENDPFDEDTTESEDSMDEQESDEEWVDSR